MNRNRKTRYDLKLPHYDKGNYDNNNTNNLRFNDPSKPQIPMSLIARNLQKKLYQYQIQITEAINLAREQENDGTINTVNTVNTLNTVQTINTTLYENEHELSTDLDKTDDDDDDCDELDIEHMDIDITTPIGGDSINEYDNENENESKQRKDSGYNSDNEENINKKDNNNNENSKNNNSNNNQLQAQTANLFDNISAPLEKINSTLDKLSAGIRAASSSIPGLPSKSSKLRMNLIPITSLSDTKLVNTESVDIGNSIINAFSLLYNKYICDSAHYLINISSRTKNRLKKVYDVKYYQIRLIKQQQAATKRKSSIFVRIANKRQDSENKFKKKQNNNNNNNNDGDDSKEARSMSLDKIHISVWDRMRFEHNDRNKRTSTSSPASSMSASIKKTLTKRFGKNANKKNKNKNKNEAIEKSKSTSSEENIGNKEIEIDFDGNNVHKYNFESNSNSNSNSPTNSVIEDEMDLYSMMNADFEKYAKNGGLLEYELFIWLLDQLIENMEYAVLEIAKVMKDSFLRFKEDQQIYHQVVHLALEEQHRAIQRDQP